MCKIQWFLTSTTTLWTISTILLNVQGISAVGGCTNSSSCNNYNLSSLDCICNSHNHSTNCTATISKFRITIDKLMATSSMNDEIHAGRGQVENLSSSWCGRNSTVNQYLQIDLGRVYEIWLIRTRSVHTSNMSGHVTSYKMTYSLDSSRWYSYKEDNNSLDKTFRTGVYQSCTSLNVTSPLVARFIRIHPLTWVQHICMGVDLYGVPHICPLLANPCSSNASCAIFTNSTVCLCPRGFYYDGQSCSDIDECKAQVNTSCHPKAACFNTNGSFTCVCKHGYYGNTSYCTDIDECSEHAHSCSPSARCINNDGSYTCLCKTGYHGNGRTCMDLNECFKKLHSCHGNASCYNSPGSYSCLCDSGFKGDGKNCTDIDECSTLTPRACRSVHSICNNVPGSYYCTCSNGYYGDGQNCTADDVPSMTYDHSRHLGLTIGIPVVAVGLLVAITVALIHTRYRRRRMRVIRRPKQPNQSGSRPSSTVIGQIDRLFDDDRKVRDSVSLRSLPFSIPSVHQSLTTLNNIGLTANNYETLQA